MIRTNLAIALFTLTTSVGSAGFMPWTDVFKMADADADGMLTPKEVIYFKDKSKAPGFQPFMVDHFADLDVNKDGMLDMKELETAKDDTMSKAFFEKQGFMPTHPQ